MQNKEGIVMKLEMTQKDKNLLIMLSIFVIVVCIGYWGIYPVVKGIVNTNKEITTQKETKESSPPPSHRQTDPRY